MFGPQKNGLIFDVFSTPGGFGTLAISRLAHYDPAISTCCNLGHILGCTPKNGPEIHGMSKNQWDVFETANGVLGDQQLDLVVIR